MEKDRTIVSKSSKLYYVAVIVAIVSVVLKFLLNYLQYGTIAWEFTQKSIGIEGLGEMSAPILGAVAYFLPAAAALVLGLSLKNAPAEPEATPPQLSAEQNT